MKKIIIICILFLNSQVVFSEELSEIIEIGATNKQLYDTFVDQDNPNSNYFIKTNLRCGLKPLPPLGCKSSDAVCMCDSDGNCQWVFRC